MSARRVIPAHRVLSVLRVVSGHKAFLEPQEQLERKVSKGYRERWDCRGR